MEIDKIVVVDPASYSTYYSYCYVKSLADQGLNIEFLTTKFPYEEVKPPENVKTIYFFFKISSFLNLWFKSRSIRRMLRALEYPFNLCALCIRLLRDKPKLVHYIWVAIPIIDLLFFKVLKAIGIKIIYTAHNPFPHELKPWHKWLYKKVYNNVDHIITLTEYVKETVLENTSVGSEKITVIPHGDFDYIFSQVIPNRDLELYLEKKTKGCKVVSLFGAVRPYKGLEYLIQAFALVKEQIPNVKLFVCGKCYTDSDFYINLASKLKLEDDIIFDFRFIPLSDFLSYLNLTHVTVLPYVDASQSGSVVMSYKKGIPVVVTEVGGLPEMVIYGESGIVVQSKDIVALAEGIVYVLENKYRYQRMSSFARELASKEYSWEKIAKMVIEKVYCIS